MKTNYSNYEFRYNVDIAMCLDATGSMGDLLDKVKANALSLYDDIVTRMAEKGKHVDRIRARIIAFRDYAADGRENAMLTTGFFELPYERQQFSDALSMIQPDGGGDIPEDGLEALYYAIKSDWDMVKEPGKKNRHIIAIWSDANTHDLGVGDKMLMPDYPKHMARSYAELSDMWDNRELIDPRSRRLIIFAPDEHHWNDIEADWEQVLFYPSEAGNGLEKLNYETILDAICNSIA